MRDLEEISQIKRSMLNQGGVLNLGHNHPEIIKEWLPKESGLYKVDPNYKPTKKQKKHRMMIKLEKLLGLDLSKKHYKLV